MRLIGALCCFLTCFLAGILAGKKEKQRTAECEAFLTLFEYVKNQVDYFLAPTKVIYRNFENEILSQTGFLDALCAHESDEVYFNAWQDALNSCKGRFTLTKGQMEIVLAFGSCIGKSHEKLQINSFEYYIKAMTAETARQKDEMKKNMKLYRTLGFSIGAAIAILLI